ncbi:MAG: carbonic anhydrase [Phycisphaerae bacterium]|nr:carbonic anhydrase [Gemmatimonadaceae bacterium]
MKHFERILKNNKQWAALMKADDPDYFTRRSAHQEPHFLFIGCSDSRVPTELLTGVAPGELFSHRNIANQVFPSDLNLLSVLQYAVDVLDVEHVIVCGHYSCGGVKAAMGSASYGVVDHWLSNIRNVVRWNQDELDAIEDEDARFRRLVELNAIEQVYQLSRSPIVQRSWARGRRPMLHGLVYDLHDGLLRTLVSGIDGADKAHELAGRAVVGSGA